MSKHPLLTKVKIPPVADAKEFMRVELEAFEKSYPKPDRDSYIKYEEAHGSDPILYPDDRAEYEAALEQFWDAWSEYTKTHAFQDRLPKSANRLVQDKFATWAEEKGIELYSEVFWSLWDVMKEQDGFQVTVGQGGGPKNKPSDTWREDMFKMSKVADYIHRHGLKGQRAEGKAAELCGVNRGYLSTLINQKYPDYWEVLMDGRPAEKDEIGAIPDGQGGWKLEGKVVAAENKEFFTGLSEKLKQQKESRLSFETMPSWESVKKLGRSDYEKGLPQFAPLLSEVMDWEEQQEEKKKKK
jgi:hypothetical protein